MSSLADDVEQLEISAKSGPLSGDLVQLMHSLDQRTARFLSEMKVSLAVCV